MLNCGDDEYASYPDLIIIYRIYALKCHTILHKYVQLLCVNLK
jgi:hypothetical protein